MFKSKKNSTEIILRETILMELKKKKIKLQ